MSHCNQTLILRVMDFIVEDYLCRLCWPIDYVDTRTHPILDGLLVMESKFHQRCEISVVEETHIFQSIFLAKCLSGIFEIEWI